MPASCLCWMQLFTAFYVGRSWLLRPIHMHVCLCFDACMMLYFSGLLLDPCMHVHLLGLVTTASRFARLSTQLACRFPLGPFPRCWTLMVLASYIGRRHCSVQRTNWPSVYFFIFSPPWFECYICVDHLACFPLCHPHAML